MKKIKPLYIYLAGIVICIILFYIASPKDKNNVSASSMAIPPGDVTNQQMPNDSVHKGLMNPLAQKPSKDNVMSSIMQHMEELKKDVEKHPNDTLKMKEYADFLNEAHQKDQAIIYYQKILKKDPKRIDILTSLVFIYYGNKNFNGAEECLNKILKIDNNNVDAMYNLGAVYANKGEKAKARQIWQRIINNFPSSSMAQKARESIQML
jgi:tetratricopeptide (TPR) repeat protein